MIHSTKFSGFVSSYKHRRFRYGAFVGSLIMALSNWVVLKPYLSTGHRPYRAIRYGEDHIKDKLGFYSAMPNRVSDHEVAENQKAVGAPLCNVLETRSDFCEISGDIRVQGNSSTVFVSSLQVRNLAGKSSWTIRPYARKENAGAMELVKNWSVVSVTSNYTDVPNCSVNHGVPAIIFSLGGFSGNHFHDFTDLVIPLYVTSRPFNGQVQLLVTDLRPWWISKFRKVLKKLSRFEIINIDKEEKIHCYPSIIVGLKSHKELSIGASMSLDGVSMRGFRNILIDTYSLKRTNAIKMKFGENRKPRLMIISRRNSRAFTNERRIKKMAKSLGYDVVMAEANLSTDLSRFAQLVNSCDALMGVHGAGLTNMVFLPDDAVVIQILPLGEIEGLARDDFEGPAKDMNLRYLEYKIKVKESTLARQYPPDDEILINPLSVHERGWDAVKVTYLEKQNVKLDVRRFRATLLAALELLHQ